MNISEEKQRIYKLMEMITEERKALTNMYVDLTIKLDNLNLQEQRENLEKSRELLSEATSKINEELRKIDEIRDKSNVVEPIIEDEIKDEVEDKIEDKKEIKYGLESFGEHIKPLEEIKDDIIPKEEIEKEKDKLPKRSPYLSLDKVAGVLANILKESGKPMNVQDIHLELNKRLDRQINIQNLRNNMLPRITKKNTKIERVMHGYYQYRM